LNRANVSKVFGELLTILEADKRGLPVTLSQSRREFSVPPNVYLVATMNTADRSIALLDAALRRRFAFIEVTPDYELLDGVVINGLSLAAFLKELNARVSREFGREKEIGHSFLMGPSGAITTPEEFAERFYFDIFPLLEELSYADSSAIANILSPRFTADDEPFGPEVSGTKLISWLLESFPDAVRS
jgi:5-methylcytosine-specific restriction protein B